MKRNLKRAFLPYKATYGAIGGVVPARKKAQAPPKRRRSRRGTLAGPYQPISKGVPTFNEPGAKWPVIVPDSMDTETNAALHKLRDALGGDVSLFVQERLGYATHADMAQAFVAEQVDAIALAIYNIEVRNEGLIIADQTGIGKGRIAAGLIRYAHHQGLFPIFLTERPNLFSDIYRDLANIGSDKLRPFIVNNREKKTDVQDEGGKIIYQAPQKITQLNLINQVVQAAGEDGEGQLLPDSDQPFAPPTGKQWRNRPQIGQILDGYECILATYSQFNLGFDWLSDGKNARKTVKDRSFKGLGLKGPKCQFLATAAKGNLLILDESHNASGSSNTGEFMAQVLGRTRGVAFLSATFAKRPDNMVVYGKKTILREAGLTDDALVSAITKGGVALQEIVSSQLVNGGQLLRRERPYDGVEVNWLTLTAQAAVHRSRSDEMMAILRDVITFQHQHVDKYLKLLNNKEGGGKVGKTKGTSEGGISNTPMFSRVFNVVFQMLFGIKAEAVAAHAISRLQEGKKVIITFQSTMGAFIEGLSNDEEEGGGDDEENGLAMAVDTRVRATFDVVLERVLNLALAITETSPSGAKTKKFANVDDISAAARQDYTNLLLRIKNVTTEVSISPIDLVTKIIRAAGYNVAEVTGRSLYLDLADNNKTGVVRSRVKEPTANAFRRFNQNLVDVLLLNAAGSTGNSAQAMPTKGMSPSEVKQRVMIIHQPSLDINTEVQKRGRVFRTGQLLAPIYDYLVSAIPAEQRLMMMLQRKLKSLDANTTSNQKNSSALMDAEFPDFLNHHGDRIVAEYLLENVTLNKRLGDPLAKCDTGVVDEDGTIVLYEAPEGFALKVTGRVAVLATALQTEFYTEISVRYKDHIAYLDNTGQNDLEVKDLDLRARITERQPLLAGPGGETRSAFGGSVFLETADVLNLTKPMTGEELLTVIREALGGRTAEEVQQELMDKVKAFYGAREDDMRGGFDWPAAIAKELTKRKTPKNLEKENPKAYAELVNLITGDLQEGLNLDSQKIRNDRAQMLSLATKFKIGYGSSVPNPDIEVHVGADDYLPGCFLGFTIDEKRRNPYARSAIKLTFALAAPQRSYTLPASTPLAKTAVNAYNMFSRHWNGPLTLEVWQRLTQREMADRERRYMLSGNMLLALGSPELGNFRLPLVSYTMEDGTIRKGIFLPRKFNETRTLNADGTTQRQGISQSLRSKGLAARLANIFAENLGYGKNGIKLEMRDQLGGVFLTVKKDGSPYTGGQFTLWLGWETVKQQNQGKTFLKNLPLLMALGKQYELSAVRGAKMSADRRYEACYVPVEKLERVLSVLGDAGCAVSLSKTMLDDYPDLFPENRNFDTEPWAAPANMPEPAPAPDRARALRLAKAKVLVLLALQAQSDAEVPALAGVRRGGRPPRRGEIAHPNIRAYVR